VTGNVRFIVDSEEKVDKRIISVLERMAEAEGVVPPVVALPDIHYKLSYHTPTGVVAMARDRIIPKFLNPNCGMSFVVTPLFSGMLDNAKIDGIYGHIRKNISVSTRIRPAISRSDMENIIMTGARWAFDKFGLNTRDLANFENEGTLFKAKTYAPGDVLKYIPESCMRMGLVSLNVLGYGNHFIEMQEVEKIYDEKTAASFGLKEKQVCFMLHGDSRAFGRSITDFYSKKAKKFLGLQQLYKKAHYRIMSAENVPDGIKELMEKANYRINRFKSAFLWKVKPAASGKAPDFKSIAADSEEGKAFKLAFYAAQNFGYANRAAMAAVIRNGLREAFNDKGLGVSILYDGNHDCLQEETIDGETLLAHRNGASRAVPASMYKDHPVFSITGQPVLLPSSMGNPSFLMASGQGSRDSFYSAPHGAGRLIDRGEARGKFTGDDIISQVGSKGMRVYDYGKGNVSEESPAAFKNIDSVVKAVSDNNIAKPVAKMRPLAVLKGWT